ncbi:MAG: YitT family protein [Agathobacter sp.]|nr:YitT family protein [Agathobacter sp.]
MVGRKHERLFAYLYIILGTAVLAVSIQCFFEPIGLVTGGFTGLAIVIKSVTKGIIDDGIPIWLSNIFLNAPVFILAFILKGRKFVGRTIFGAGILSVWLYIIPTMDMSQGDFLLAAIFGAVFSGAGIGLVLRGHATTGGTDMVAALIQLKIKHYSIAQIMQILDGIVVITGLFVFGIRPAMYAMVAIFVATKVTDIVLEGFRYSKAAYIITDKHEEIAQRIMVDIDRGVTGIHAMGMYTGEEKCVLYCVVSMREIIAVEELVSEIDPNAFVIVSDVREVLGEGFKEYPKNA